MELHRIATVRQGPLEERDMRFTHSLMTGVAFAAMGFTAPAFAQDAEAAPQSTEENADSYGDDIVVTATRREQLSQDVPLAVTVVGGEALENSGITDIRGIRQLTPSLQTTTGQSAATGVSLSIRGIGTAGDNPGFEPAVGVFIDGVFRARAGLALAELPPIERVEVLRGPQGTLFGRNTSAGALSITTEGPEFQFGGYVEAEYGNYDALNLQAGINIPAGESLALRVDGGYRRRDGYILDINSGNDINDINRYWLRAQALYETDRITFRLIADYQETDEVCCGAINTGSGLVLPLTNTDNAIARIATGAVLGLTGNPATGGAVGRIGIPLPYTRGSRRMAVTPGRDYLEQVQEWGISGQFDIELGDITLTSITAYRDWDARRNQDIDFSGLDRAYRENYRTGLTDFTQEIRLQGEAFDGNLDWLVGGFYLNERLTLTDTVRFGAQGDIYVDSVVNGLTRSAALPTGLQLFGRLGPGVPLFGQVALATNPTLLAAALGNPALFALFNSPLPATPNGGGQIADNYRVNTEAFALFTHNIFHITDSLDLTVGLRYNRETKDIDTNLNSAVPACGFYTNPANALYVQALQGAGLLGLANLYTCNPTVNSEFNGSRSDSRSESEFTGTVRLSFELNDDILLYAGYDRGYKSGGYNLDRASFDTRVLGGNGAQLTDLEFGNESVDAFEIGIKTNLSREIQFNVAAFRSDYTGYQSLRFVGTQFVTRNFNEVISQGVEIETLIRPVRNLTFQLAYTYLDAAVNDPLAGDDNGRQLTNQPRNVVTGAMTWTPALSDNVTGLVHVDFRMQSDSTPVNTPAAQPFVANDGYEIVNARVGLTINESYSIEAYVENVFNTYYNITAFPIPEQGASFAVYPSPPRFYGLRVRAAF
jgi:iron complex outermembrane recepter protein